MVRIGGGVFLAAILVFLLAPAFVVAVASFNPAASFPSDLTGFTLAWYMAIFARDGVLDSIDVSAVVAASSAALASVLGSAAAYGIKKRPSGGGAALANLMLGPLLVPQLIAGLALLQTAAAVGTDVGMSGLIAAHTVAGMPFTFRLAVSGLARFDFALEEAATSLGATTLQAARFVILPMIRPGLVAGFAFAFVLSFVNLPLSLFLTTPATATLPIQMFAYIESRIDPMIAALSTLVVAGAFVVSVAVEKTFKLRIAS